MLSNPLARLGLVALAAGALVACSPGGSEFDREWAAQQSAQAAARASSEAATPAAGASETAAEPSPSPSPITIVHVFPVRSAKAHYGAYHHDYPAADIFAPCGTRVAAPYSGTISEVSRTDTWSAKSNDGAVRGGLSVTLVGDDGVRYYGSHLRSIEKGIKAGATVAAGATLGHVGNTGDAAGIACHLHFGISPPCGTGDWQIRRGAVSPYRFLRAWQKNDDLSPTKTVAAYRKKGGCSA